MKLKQFLEVLDVLPSSVKVSAAIRLTAYTSALAGHGLEESDFDEILNRGLESWTFYPAPAEILATWRDIQALRYQEKIRDCILIPVGEGRMRIVARNSPEGVAEIARLEAEKQPGLEGENHRPRFLEAADRVIGEQILEHELTDKERQKLDDHRRDVLLTQAMHLRKEVTG